MYTFKTEVKNRQDFQNGETIVQVIIANNEGIIPEYNMFRKYVLPPELINDDFLQNDIQTIIHGLISEYESSINQVIPE